MRGDDQTQRAEELRRCRNDQPLEAGALVGLSLKVRKRTEGRWRMAHTAPISATSAIRMRSAATTEHIFRHKQPAHRRTDFTRAYCPARCCSISLSCR